jgi:hypothetical protein
MSFELLEADGTVTITSPDGEVKAEDLKPGTGPVQYTCEGDRFRQEADGYLSVYERSG